MLDEFNDIINQTFNEFSKNNDCICHNLVEYCSQKSNISIIPPVASQLRLETIEMMKESLIQICEQISDELKFNFDETISLKKQIEQMTENNTNSID